MIRKIVYYFFSFFLVVFLFITFSEIFLQILPFIYKKISFPTDKTYIYVLGESSAFGHPYMGKINFSKIVAKTTDWNIDDKKIEIINFAEPGSKPLYQYQKYSFYRYTHPFQKGMVFVYMLGTNGNIFDNDYANNKYKQYNEIIINSVLFLWTHPYFCKTFNLEYYYNALSKLMNKFGDEVYISTVVGNYSGIMPNNVESLIKDKDLREKIGLIDELILNNKYDEALQKISDIIDKYEDKSQILYRVGKIYEKQNKIKEANEVYRNMIGDDDARPTIKENEMIRTLAKQYKFELIDVEEELISRNEIIGFNYFMDLVHPTIDLNILIAKKFTDKLKQKHLINDNDYDIKEDILHEFSDKDWFIIYRDALGEIFFYSCRKYIFDIYTKEQISKYIKKLYELHNKIGEEGSEEFNKREEILHICETLFECIQGNNEKVVYLINKYNLKNTIFKRGCGNRECRMQGLWYLKHWLIHSISKNNIQ